MEFYLGTHMPSWLGQLNVPLFVSTRRLSRRASFPRAIAPWALDSGGFTELSTYGTWQTSPETYLCDIARYENEVGALAWCAPQDWMCEPVMLKRTGLTVAEHQRLTVDNLLDLRDRGSARPIIPVLQGWEIADYLRCIEMYDRAGIDLSREPVVGLGTVCRRQHTEEAAELVETIADLGFPIHGFGLKMQAVTAVGHLLASCDSMAWSYNARRNPRLPGCTHVSCSNCPKWALAWRERLLAKVAGEPVPRQLSLPI